MPDWISAIWNAHLAWWLAGLLMLCGAGVWLWRTEKQRRRWRFRRHIPVSLTGLRDGWLRIRPLAIVDTTMLLADRTALKKIWRGAKGVTAERPFPKLDSDEFREYLQIVGQWLAAQFGHGQLLLDQGLSTHTAEYVVGMVFEANESGRGLQLRIVIVARQLLETLPTELPVMEHESQRQRWQTLQAMAKVWQENPLQLTVIDIVLPGQPR